MIDRSAFACSLWTSRLIPLACLLCFALPLAAEEVGEGPPAKPPEPMKVVTEHSITTADGEALAYTATAEEIYVHGPDGEPMASYFTISYTAKGAEPADRPVTFVFNGGPGSSSIWLHLGMVGPKLIDAPSDASDPGNPPYELRDNPWTLLRATDLVMVDPVGTGFSKALGEHKNDAFWGFDEDADSVAEFIRTFITTHNRWNSPKYLLGESYGGIRSGLLVPRLQQQLGMALSGVILVSPALNLGTLPFFVEGNDLPYATHLPALAATAHYHGQLPDEWPSLEALLDEVEQFAGGDYLRALFWGATLPEDERLRIAQALHRYTGLSVDYVLRSNLRIYPIRFIKELLRDEGRSVALLDGRYAQDELNDVGEFPGGDPFSAKTSPIYLATFQNYLRNELGVDKVNRFIGTNMEANQAWKRPASGSHPFFGYVDVTAQLAQGTKDNESLRIFSAGGYHDLTTSYFATEYMLWQSGIDSEAMTLVNYEGGHMMYLYQPALEALSNDVIAFIRGD